MVNVSTANATRTITGSMQRYSAIPLQTPATTRSDPRVNRVGRGRLAS